ncbi:MAG: response regulator transcription factor [Chloroflexota bacterium]|nr:response regulator transcription factor [Chloroflexota bacterium]
MIRLIIISEIRLYADGLAEILNHSGRISTLSVADSVGKGIDAIEQYSPDVVLLDMSLHDSCQAVRQIASNCPSIRIVALSVPEDATHIHTCAEAGIIGYVAREDSIEELLKAIENSLRGEIHCPPHLANFLFRKVEALAKQNDLHSPPGFDSQVKPSAHELSGEPLTRREKQIADLLLRGLSNKQIARDLSIELSTVKNHVHNILVKVGATSRTQAVLMLKGQISNSISRSLDLEARY